MHENVSESVLFIGLAIKTRNKGNCDKHTINVVNDVIHARDTVDVRSTHAQHHQFTHTNPFAAFKVYVPTLLAPYGDKHIDEIYGLVGIDPPSRRQVEKAVSDIKKRVARSNPESKFTPRQLAALAHMQVQDVIRAFRTITQGNDKNPTVMEEIFILGCAGAVRNVVTCLQTIATSKDGREVLDVFFGRINTSTFDKKLSNPSNDSTNLYEEFETLYGMLSAIMHAEDKRGQRGKHAPPTTTFFHKNGQDLFHDRFDTIRWEVLKLVFEYLLLPTAGISLRSRLIPHLVLGPTYFFAVFPELGATAPTP
jgi:hypothetical protein